MDFGRSYVQVRDRFRPEIYLISTSICCVAMRKNDDVAAEALPHLRPRSVQSQRASLETGHLGGRGRVADGESSGTHAFFRDDDSDDDEENDEGGAFPSTFGDLKGGGTNKASFNLTSQIMDDTMVLKDFRFVRTVGKGTYGEVWKARQRDTQEIFAIKVLDKGEVLKNQARGVGGCGLGGGQAFARASITERGTHGSLARATRGGGAAHPWSRPRFPPPPADVLRPLPRTRHPT